MQLVEPTLNLIASSEIIGREKKKEKHLQEKLQTHQDSRTLHDGLVDA
jgi:hypothetical protein